MCGKEQTDPAVPATLTDRSSITRCAVSAHLVPRFADHACKNLALSSVGFLPVCSAVVAVEVLVLSVNGYCCPMTSMARRFTDERRENFEIDLPNLAGKAQQADLRCIQRRGRSLRPLEWVRMSWYSCV
jgi:hypothetical protein